MAPSENKTVPKKIAIEYGKLTTRTQCGTTMLLGLLAIGQIKLMSKAMSIGAHHIKTILQFMSISEETIASGLRWIRPQEIILMTLTLMELKALIVPLVVLSVMMITLLLVHLNILTVTSVTTSSTALLTTCITTIQLEPVTVTLAPAFG